MDLGKTSFLLIKNGGIGVALNQTRHLPSPIFNQRPKNGEAISFVPKRQCLYLLSPASLPPFSRTHCIQSLHLCSSCSSQSAPRLPPFPNDSSPDIVTQLSTIDSVMEEELKVLSEWFDLFCQKHVDYTESIQNYIRKNTEDQAQMKHVEGELEEAVAGLEESRRKLVNHKMQKRAASETYTPSPGAVNGNIPPEKIYDKSMGLQELKDSIEEAQIVSEDRLSELKDTREDNMILSKQ